MVEEALRRGEANRADFARRQAAFREDVGIAEGALTRARELASHGRYDELDQFLENLLARPRGDVRPLFRLPISFYSRYRGFIDPGDRGGRPLTSRTGTP